MKSKCFFFILLGLFLACQRNDSGNYPPFPVFDNLRDGIAMSAKNNQPILIVFDWNGSSINAMEALEQSEIQPIITKHYNVVRVLIDDRTPWPEEKKYLNRKGKQISTYGAYYIDLQVRWFNEVYQPMYAILTPDGQPMLANGKPLFCGYVKVSDSQAVAQLKKMLEQPEFAH